MNKARRRQKKNRAEGEPFSRQKAAAVKAAKLTSEEKIKRAKRLIQKHLDDAGRTMNEAMSAVDNGDYGEAGKLLREAGNLCHLANAERRRLPEDALQ